MNRKKFVSCMLAVALTATSVLTGVSPLAVNAEEPTDSEHGNIQAEFFVSESGSDENPGTYEQPFASVERAKEAVAEINQDMTGDIYVFIMPGTYYVPESINFNVADSGTNGYEIIYKCLGDAGSARLSGGIRVDSEWEQVSASTDPADADSDMQEDLEGKIYKTNLKDQLDEVFPDGEWPATSGPLPTDEDGRFSVNTLTVNDKRATLARTLNSEKFAGMPSTLFDNPLYTAGGDYTMMNYKESDESTLNIQKLENAQARGDLSVQLVCNDIGGKRAWDSDTLPIIDVDSSANKLTFNPDDVSDFAPLYVVGTDSRYYLQGSLAFLDTPGEFYYNPVTYDLYYYPQEGEEDLSAQEIVVPTTQKVINITGERTGIWDDTEITPVHNITFDGLKFSDTSFPDYYSSGFPWLGYFDQSRIPWYDFPEWAQESSNPVYCGGNERPQFQVGTVHLEYADSITIENCHVKNAAMNGIEMYLGVTNTVVDNSLVEYCGNGGIQIEGGYPAVDGTSDAVSFTNNNTVKNTVVHDVGQMVHQTFGIQVSHATYNTITNCEIYNSPRRGLLLTGSDIGSWNNTASGNRNWNPDNAYDVKRDEYAHGNTFSNIYLHDVQQDGGDDGGLFSVFVYYSFQNFSRPNTYDQIVIDEVGAQPNMGDIAPNNINLDMGWCGIEMSNIKTVNPQHYTIENSHLQDGEVKVENCTFDFKNGKDGIDTFDDSKMDYANIGVQTWQYPEAYRDAVTYTATERPEDVYFSEDFEKGIDLEKWSAIGEPQITKSHMSEGPFNGKASLMLNNTGAVKPVLYKEFDETLNKTVTVKIFDRVLSPGTTYSGEGRQLQDTGRTTVRVDDGTDENMISMGIDLDVDRNYYVMNIGGEKVATEVHRVFGWHELTFDYSESGKVTLSIDGTEVGTASRDGFDYVALGSSDGTGENYYDQLYIYGESETAAGQKADSADAQSLTGAAAQTETQNESETLIDWKFEDDTDTPNDTDETYQTPFKQTVSSSGTYSGELSGNTMLDYFNTTFNVVENPLKTDENSSDYVLGRSGQGGCHAYAQQEEWWSNYIWEFDYLYKSSDPTHVDKDNSISFIFYSQNANDNLSSGAPYQPNGYWFAINEATGSLELRKGTNMRDLTTNEILASQEIDMDAFNETWHNVKIYAKNGNGYTDLNVSVDNGAYTLKCRDASSPFTSGTIAFNSMGTDFYMDNFKISTIPDGPLSGYDSNFKFGNAVLDKAFDVNTYDYTAMITDPAEDVTLVKPGFEGAEYTVVLNGEDITDSFPDAETPVVLDLKPGNNTVTVTETTEQGVETAYTFAIYKDSTLVSTDIPETMDITVGTTPQFPAEAEITVNDGKQDYTMTSGVVWDMADQSCYRTPGTFTVTGYLDELKDETVTVTVNVDGVTAVDTLETVKGKAGEDPSALLPATVGMEYEHSGRKDVPVTFASFDSGVYAEKGTIVAVGTVEGYSKDMIQIIELDGEGGGEPEDPDLSGYRKLLQDTYDYALTLSTEGVAESAAEYFENAKAEAKAVLDNPDATKEEIVSAWDNLLQGIWGLGLTQGDKTMLGLLIDKANTMMDESEKYVQDTWQNLVDALTEAQTVYDDNDAMDGEVQSAADKLLNAILEQRLKANKSNLEDLINKAEGLDLTKYTEESVSVLNAALAEAKAVMANESLSIDDQAAVDAAAAKLDSAINGLQLADGSGDGDDTGNGNAGTDGSNGTDGQNNGNTDDSGSANKAVKTGDNSNVAVPVMGIIAAAGAAGLVIARRRRNG